VGCTRCFLFKIRYSVSYAFTLLSRDVSVSSCNNHDFWVSNSFQIRSKTDFNSYSRVNEMPLQVGFLLLLKLNRKLKLNQGYSHDWCNGYKNEIAFFTTDWISVATMASNEVIFSVTLCIAKVSCIVLRELVFPELWVTDNYKAFNARLTSSILHSTSFIRL